jgi:CheY-like chemotaxis protein
MPKTVLIVDDDTDIRNGLEELLQTEGYYTMAVASGQQALATLNDQRPCLIIADFLMPDMNGIELAQALQSTPRHATIPMILLTAANKRSLGGQLTTPVLTKPVTIDALLRVLKEHCSPNDFDSAA